MQAQHVSNTSLWPLSTRPHSILAWVDLIRIRWCLPGGRHCSQSLRYSTSHHLNRGIITILHRRKKMSSGLPKIKGLISRRSRIWPMLIPESQSWTTWLHRLSHKLPAAQVSQLPLISAPTWSSCSSAVWLTASRRTARHRCTSQFNLFQFLSFSNSS